MIDFREHRFAGDIILICVRWYLAYPLSYRNLEEMMAERGVQVSHTNIYRWVQKFTPKLEAEFRRSGSKRPVGTSWRMDETCIKVNGQWKYLYRAVEKAGQSVDFLLTARRTLAGIELMHMLKKNQMIAADGQELPAAEQFYSLAAELLP